MLQGKLESGWENSGGDITAITRHEGLRNCSGMAAFGTGKQDTGGQGVRRGQETSKLISQMLRKHSRRKGNLSRKALQKKHSQTASHENKKKSKTNRNC